MKTSPQSTHAYERVFTARKAMRTEIASNFGLHTGALRVLVGVDFDEAIYEALPGADPGLIRTRRIVRALEILPP